MSQSRIEWIEQTLRKNLAPSHFSIEDESAKHAGHAGARSGGGHFRIVIVAEAFRGKTAVQRHQAVYAALGRAMQTEIHALVIKALAPEEWQAP